MLNKALQSGNFLYLFDRCLELGNDSIIIDLTTLPSSYDVNSLDTYASRVGYKKVKSNNQYVLYHYNVNHTFGTINEYDAIGIGTTASTTSLIFPSVKETISTNLNDYTYNDLSKYKTIILSGFTYDDQKQAEDLILKLSESGIKIIIMADGIPESKKNHSRSFLGARCYDISFSNGFASLDTIDGTLYPDLFPQGHTKWDTVHINGLDEIYGQIKEEDKTLPFYGTVKNKNIVMIGLNLHYFYSLTNDKNIEKLLNHTMNLDHYALPIRKIVPIDIKETSHSFIVNSNYAHVNTSVSFHDEYTSDAKIINDNHLLVVNKGNTKISIKYPYFAIGSTITICGILLSLCYFKNKLKK